MARAMAPELSNWLPDIVFASPLRRASWPAAIVARRISVPLRIDARLSERNFGTWEGRTWDDIHAETGEAMMGMLTAPETFRPGGGETTTELSQRVLAWRCDLPAEIDALVFCHGGPIAVLVGTAKGLAPKEWPQVIPPTGDAVTLET